MLTTPGPATTNGYYGQTDEQKRAAFVDEWLRSGDVGFVDADGYVFITGRNKVRRMGATEL
jgi:long-subunit acyl-CoA synthetase (AMP-forming)